MLERCWSRRVDQRREGALFQSFSLTPHFNESLATVGMALRAGRYMRGREHLWVSCWDSKHRVLWNESRGLVLTTWHQTVLMEGRRPGSLARKAEQKDGRVKCGQNSSLLPRPGLSHNSPSNTWAGRKGQNSAISDHGGESPHLQLSGR